MKYPSLSHSCFRFLTSIKDREIFYICQFGQNLTQVNTKTLPFFIQTHMGTYIMLLYLDLGTYYAFMLRPGGIYYALILRLGDIYSTFVFRLEDMLYFYSKTWGYIILLFLDLGTNHTFILRPGDISYFYS